GVGLFLALDEDLVNFPAIEQAGPPLEFRLVFGSERADGRRLFEIDGSSDLQPVLRPEVERLQSYCFAFLRQMAEVDVGGHVVESRGVIRVGLRGGTALS